MKAHPNIIILISSGGIPSKGDGPIKKSAHTTAMNDPKKNNLLGSFLIKNEMKIVAPM